MTKKNILMEIENKQPEETYDSPDGSEWIITIAEDGSGYALTVPNVHFSFLENGRCLEDIGITGYESMNAGVYKIIVSYSTNTCWETGYIDDYSFDITSSEQILTIV